MAIAIACVFGAAVSAGAAETDQAGVAAGSFTAKSSSKFSAEQLAEIQLRMDLANRIARNVADDAHDSGAPENWRATLMNALLRAHSSTLRNIAGSARTVFDARTRASEAITGRQHATSSAVIADSALGSSIDSLVYIPMTPCRFVDTRNVGGPIGATPQQFDTEKEGFLYGGDSACTVPGAGEPAIAANVTLVAPATSAGYLTVRPAGSTNVTSWLNFNQSGPNIAVANQGVISTARDSSTGHYLFEIFVNGGPADVVVDYFGYFSAAPRTAVDCSGIPNTVFTIAPNTSNSYYATCPAGYAVVAPYCDNLSSPNVSIIASGVTTNSAVGPGNFAYCRFANQSSVYVFVTMGANCCRIP